MIERLDPGQPEPTLVWKDGADRDFASLTQITRKDGLKRGVLLKAVTAVLDLPAQPFDVREQRPVFDGCVDALGGPKRVIIHQIVAAEQYVVALQVWIGDPNDTPEPRPRTAGMLFTLNAFTVHNSRDTWMLRADSIDGYGNVKDSDQFFNRVARFPDIAEVIDICSEAPTCSRLSSRVTLIHDSARLVNLEIVAKRVGDRVYGLGHEITQWVPPQLDTLTLMRSTGTVPEGRYTAVIAFRRGEGSTPAIVLWVTPPPSWVQYWDSEGPLQRGRGGLIHPSDRAAIIDARTQLDSQTTGAVELTVRLRAGADSWEPLSMRLTPYPSQEKKLYVAEFTDP